MCKNLPITRVKRSSPCSPSSFNNPYNGQFILIKFNQYRLISSAPISTIELNDDHHEHSDLKSNLSTQPLSCSKVLNSSVHENQQFSSTLSQQQQIQSDQKKSELMRVLIVLKLCSYPLIVDNNQKLIKLGQKALGRRLFRALMKVTFYGHFVAGENEKEMMPKINHLSEFGVKSIFDYSAEDELQEIDKNASQQSTANK